MIKRFFMWLFRQDMRLMVSNESKNCRPKVGVIKKYVPEESVSNVKKMDEFKGTNGEYI